MMCLGGLLFDRLCCWTRSQLRICTMHMINSAVSNALMPRLVMVTANTPLAISYAFAVHQLALSELVTSHFIGAIIDKETGTVLEYRHLFCVGNKFCEQNRMPVPEDTRSERHEHVLLHTEIASCHQQTAHIRLDCL
jgi:hypothetical protein